jgi:hypothetical protein
MCGMAESADGRCFYQVKTLASDGSNPLDWKQRHGIETRRFVSPISHHWLASEQKAMWKTRFCFSEAKIGRIRGRLLLARMQIALAFAKIESALLAHENWKKSSQRPNSK